MKVEFISLLILGLLSIYIQSGAALTLVCPNGWTKIYELCYAVFPSTSSWAYANQNCQRYGGKLVEPAGLVLTESIVGLVDDYITSTSDFNIQQIWTGLNRRGYIGNNNADGYWSDGVLTSVDVGNWGEQEPKVDVGECAYIDATNQKWYMKSCDFLFPAVCQLTPCPDNTFRCVNGRTCLALSKTCDGIDDCGDYSDERDCPNHCRRYIYIDNNQPQTIKYPTGNGNYSSLATCEWSIEGRPGYNIQLQVESLDTEKYLDYLEFWEGEPTWYDSAALYRMSGVLQQSDSYKLLMSRNNFMTTRFVSDHSLQGRGFTVKSRIGFKCQWIEIKNSKMVHGQQTNNCESVCLNDQTCLGRLVDKTTNLCYNIEEFTKLTRDPCCDMYIKSCPGITGLPDRSKMPNIGGEVEATSTKKQLFTPFYPSLYPGNIEIAWIIRTSGRNIINIEIVDVDICGSDQVLIKDGDNPVSSILSTLTSSSTAGDIIMSTGNSLYVYFVLQEHMSCRGVFLTFQQGCYFVITSNNGTIKTPGHRVKSYPPLTTCKWLIRSESGRKLNFMFEDFDAHTNDYVQVYRGENDQGSGVYSGQGHTGSSTPSPVEAPDGVIFVVFTAKATSTNLGFKAKFTSDCQRLSNSSMQITTHLTTWVLECLAGYYFEEPYTGESSVTLTCQENGQYDKIIPQCTSSACTVQPSTIAGGSVTLIYGDGTSSGSVLQYACQNGYELVGSERIVCQTGAWSQSPPVCSKIKCAEPYIQNGILDKAGPFEEGDILRVICYSGFTISGNTDTFVCSNSAVVPSCVNINECDRIPKPCECPPGTSLCLNSSCTDTEGGYYCNCPTGHAQSETFNFCEAIQVTQTYYKASVNAAVTLNCIVDSTGSDYVIMWKKDGNVIDTSLSRYQHGDASVPALTINAVTISDSGDYTCFANTSAMSQSGAVITLFVQASGAPDVSFGTTSLVGAYRGTIQLPCSFSPINYNLITWYLNGTLLSTAGGSKYNVLIDTSDPSRINAKLVIYSLNKTDIGYYQCQVVNGVGTGQSDRLFLNVRDLTDYCNPLPCDPQNFAVCTPQGFGEYQCICKDNYYGKNCTEGGVDCDSFPCRHGGTCTPQSNGYHCSCPTGWTGQTCDSDVNECDPYPCQNSGTCVSIANDYVCLCPNGKTGKNCEQNFDPCSTDNPCVPTSVCIVNSGVASCDCSLASSGQHCYTLTSTCNTIMCENGGTCDDSSGEAMCTCLPGYTGTYCDSDINECFTIQCPANSSCIDLVDSYWCKCNDGLVGQNCDKAFNADLDLVLTSNGGYNTDTDISESALFDLNSQAMTISVLFRYTANVSPGTIFTLYGLSTKTSTPVLLVELSGSAMRTIINGQQVDTSITANVKNGAWHHVILTWNGQASGRFFIYLDGTAITSRISFGTNVRLPTYGWVLFGATYSTSTNQIVYQGRLIGRINHFFLLTTELNPLPQSLLSRNYNYDTHSVILSPLADVIQRNGGVVDYNSEVTNNICTIINNDCPGIVTSSSYPSVQTCPNDQLKVTDGTTALSWTEATFSSSVQSVDENYDSGQQVFSYGVYGIANVGYDGRGNTGNAAVCVYRLNVRQSSCSSVKPTDPLGGSQSCTATSTGERCTISCPNNEAITDIGPTYYSCSLYSMYGSNNLQERYVYPACAASVSSKYNFVFSASYTLTSCTNTIAQNLRTSLRSTFQSLSNTWDGDGYGLCGNQCNDVPVIITCSSNNVATIQAQFGLINNPLENSLSETKDANEILIDGIAVGSFDFSTGSIDPTSIQIDTTASCYGDYPQLIGSSCVKCGQGAYYNEASFSCLVCPKGQYQDSAGQTTCKSCPVGKTTYTTGALYSSSCYQACTAGNYFDFTNSQCSDCPQNTYQPSTASVTCISCPNGFVTSGSESTSLSECYDPTITTLGTGGNAGASVDDRISSGIIVVIVFGILILLILLVILTALCCFRDKIPCLGKKIEPEDKTPYVTKYGETRLIFVSYTLNDIREKRGVKPLEKQPILDDSRSNSTDFPVRVPKFMERLDGKINKNRTYISNLPSAENFMENELHTESKQTKIPRRLPPLKTSLSNSIAPAVVFDARGLPPEQISNGINNGIVYTSKRKKKSESKKVLKKLSKLKVKSPELNGMERNSSEEHLPSKTRVIYTMTSGDQTSETNFLSHDQNATSNVKYETQSKEMLTPSSSSSVNQDIDNDKSFSKESKLSSHDDLTSPSKENLFTDKDSYKEQESDDDSDYEGRHPVISQQDRPIIFIDTDEEDNR